MKLLGITTQSSETVSFLVKISVQNALLWRQIRLYKSLSKMMVEENKHELHSLLGAKKSLQKHAPLVIMLKKHLGNDFDMKLALFCDEIWEWM